MEYSDLTCLRYNQALTSIYRLYKDNYNEEFKNPETFYENPQKIMECLKKTYQKSTINNFISAILWHSHKLSPTHDPKQIERIQTIYREYGKTLKDEMERDKIGKEFDLTEKEIKSFMVWEDILTIYQKIKNTLDVSNYDQFLEFVIVSLYTLHPPVRADYANMNVFIEDDHVPQGYSENYCVLQTNPRFVFNKYKTSKHRGSTIIPIDPQLSDILMDWISIHNPSDYLLPVHILYKNQFKPMSENTLSKKIPEIFLKHGGNPVTINTLRHSFISFMSKHDQEQQIKRSNADKMMHSLPMADKYRRMVYLE